MAAKVRSDQRTVKLARSPTTAPIKPEPRVVANRAFGTEGMICTRNGLEGTLTPFNKTNTRTELPCVTLWGGSTDKDEAEAPPPATIPTSTHLYDALYRPSPKSTTVPRSSVDEALPTACTVSDELSPEPQTNGSPNTTEWLDIVDARIRN